MNKKLLIVGLILMVAVCLIIRLAPHPANFTPVFALALFAGFYLPKKWSIILPLAVMLASDLFIGLYDWKLMAVVYASIAAVYLIGVVFRNKRNILTVLTSAMLSSILFFLVTNLAVWVFSSWYAHNLKGLMLCYTLAVPFFKNGLMGDLLFVTIFFGGYESLKLLASSKLKVFSTVSTK